MDRLTARPGEADTPAIEQRGGTWHIRALPLVREVLRLSGDTLQAGFAAEVVRETSPTGALPVLFADGADHRDQRSAIARYFAPVTVTRRYETLVIERAERQLARLDGGREVDLADLTLHFSAQVAAQVIGLTESDQERMAHRLVGFFDQPEGMLAAPPQGLARVRAFVRSLPSWPGCTPSTSATSAPPCAPAGPHRARTSSATSSSRDAPAPRSSWSA
ncbi:hypothetical protein [Ornithinimicrobium sp. Y1694]|uniref:hypothetical protein n=1 Tax=Ornithinimicrobium sp. Y1694 TaxID=3418590 RepID=UPI003CE9AC77